ncbi:MAG: hypothetical protein ABSG16_01655 [Candidatus Acidiferrum sp.]|jgi:hypothetical protein
MSKTPVLTLRPNVTRPEAIRAFSEGPSARLWRTRSGALRRVAEAYVPYWGYRVEYNMAGVRHMRFFALDAVTGSLDLFEFPKLPAGEQLAAVQTRNHLTAALTPERADELLREKVLRVIFLQGFFKLRGTRIAVTREAQEFHIPYWLGFYGNADSARCRVLDAVRRRIEGGKAAAFFEHWLAA